eukprot:3477350-Pleurochrysis_carterae.AAC.1
MARNGAGHARARDFPLVLKRGHEADTQEERVAQRHTKSRAEGEYEQAHAAALSKHCCAQQQACPISKKSCAQGVCRTLDPSKRSPAKNAARACGVVVADEQRPLDHERFTQPAERRQQPTAPHARDRNQLPARAAQTHCNAVTTVSVEISTALMPTAVDMCRALASRSAAASLDFRTDRRRRFALWLGADELELREPDEIDVAKEEEVGVGREYEGCGSAAGRAAGATSSNCGAGWRNGYSARFRVSCSAGCSTGRVAGVRVGGAA